MQGLSLQWRVSWRLSVAYSLEVGYCKRGGPFRHLVASVAHGGALLLESAARAVLPTRSRFPALAPSLGGSRSVLRASAMARRLGPASTRRLLRRRRARPSVGFFGANDVP